MNKIFLVYVFIFTIFNFEAKSETSKKLTCSAYEKFIIETEKVVPYDEEINLDLLFQVDHEVGDGKGVILLNDSKIFFIHEIKDDRYLFGSLEDAKKGITHVGALFRDTGKLQITFTEMIDSELVGYSNYYYCKKSEKL